MKERYLHAVRALLDCPSGERERLLSRLDQGVAAYLEDVPEAGEEELYANFGTPAECAASLSAECAPEAVAAAKRARRTRQHALTAVLAVLLAVMTVIAAYLWSNGGLVIIQLGKGFLKDTPQNEVTYFYDD